MFTDTSNVRLSVERILGSAAPSADDIEELLGARGDELRELCETASAIRDRCFDSAARPRAITFSKKVFIPVTNLCRDVCHYCIFVETPGKLRRQNKDYYMSPERVLATAAQGAQMGCKEALLTLGDRPEDRWPEARAWLDEHGYASTIHYVAELAQMILDRTGLLPHANPGVMTAEEMRLLSEVSPSLGMMLETTSTRLWEQKGLPHYGSPDKNPALRLRALRDAGELGIPFTTGMLVGIGETPRERAETILKMRELHLRYGNIQEIIVQNFLPKPGTALGNAPSPSTEEYLAAIATTRVVFGPDMHIQAPPNLSDEGLLTRLVGAGIDDWGGVSPLTADHVNPERPWPHLDDLAHHTEAMGFDLRERVTVYPEYARDPDHWVRPSVRRQVSNLVDDHGFARLADSPAAAPDPIPTTSSINPYRRTGSTPLRVDDALLHARTEPGTLSAAELKCLLESTGEHLDELCAIADDARRYTVGEYVTYVRNHTIALDQTPLSPRELGALAADLRSRGVTELCLQSIPRSVSPFETVLDLVTSAKTAAPDLHLHAFRPADVVRMSDSIGRAPSYVYEALREAGVSTVTGTGIKTLDEAWRRAHAPEDLPVPVWMRTMRAAHDLGISSTSIFVAAPHQSARLVIRHLLGLRDLQRAGAKFTEFIPMPLPLGAMGIVDGRSRLDETRALVAVSRLALSGEISHVQVAWPRMPRDFVLPLLQSGADDLGGTLERAGEEHTEDELPLDHLALPRFAKQIGRPVRERNTLYGHPTSAPGIE